MTPSRPTTLTPDQIREAADAGVKLALQARTTVLTDDEARETNGGDIWKTIILIGGYLLGNEPKAT